MGCHVQLIGQSRCLHACSDAQLDVMVQPLEIAPVALRVIVLVCLVYGRVRGLIPAIPICSSTGCRATRVLLPLPETKYAWLLVLEDLMHVSHPITRGGKELQRSIRSVENHSRSNPLSQTDESTILVNSFYLYSV